MFSSGRITANFTVPGLGRASKKEQSANSSQLPYVDGLSIIGAGVEALALANLVSARDIVVFNGGSTGRQPSLDELQVSEYEVRERGASVCSERGNARADIVRSDNLTEVKSTDGIVISAKTTEYGAIVESLSDGLNDGQTICLVNAPLGAALEFRNQLRAKGCDRELNVLELGRLFDFASIESRILLINGLRERVGVCGVDRNETRRGLTVAQATGAQLVPSSNVIERGLSDAERIVRPVLLLSALMSGRPTSIFDPEALLSPAVIRMLVAIEREVQMLAKSYDSVVPTLVRSLDDFAGSAKRLPRPGSIEEALKTLGPALFSGLGDDQSRLSERLSEALAVDVRETFTLLVELGLLSHSPVGVISSVIEMASVVVGRHLDDHGRRISNLGLVGFDRAEIIDLVNS